MSVFLMGCFDSSQKKWVTVAKCGNGHDDGALAEIQKQLKVKKISKVNFKHFVRPNVSY